MARYTADFETSTPAWLKRDDETRVWAWAIQKIGGDEFVYGNSIKTFFEWCFSDTRKNHTLYFHNLRSKI